MFIYLVAASSSNMYTCVSTSVTHDPYVGPVPTDWLIKVHTSHPEPGLRAQTRQACGDWGRGASVNTDPAQILLRALHLYVSTGWQQYSRTTVQTHAVASVLQEPGRPTDGVCPSVCLRGMIMTAIHFSKTQLLQKRQGVICATLNGCLWKAGFQWGGKGWSHFSQWFIDFLF